MAADANDTEKNQTEATSELSEPSVYDAIVIGGGAAGLGVAIALGHAEVEHFLVLERDTIGASFAAWPAETRFITPSFPSNSIGMLDLNSIAIGVSPAYSMGVEHPTGSEFATHLQNIASFFELPVRENTDVESITKVDEIFEIATGSGTLRTKNVIWAAGEFQYPRMTGFEGSELCRHTATVESYAGLEGDDFLIIGGYESGIDAAYHLSSRNKEVQVFDIAAPWSDESSDPSVSLSTYSFERMQTKWFNDHVKLYPETPVVSVTQSGDGYELKTKSGQTFQSGVQPLYAGGFEGSQSSVSHLFEARDDGFPLLSEHDESTVTPGAFLCGPAVRHDNHDFCFIYKYRQRFAVVAKAVATSLGLPAEELERYRQWGMYLDDLSCCGVECLTC